MIDTLRKINEKLIKVYSSDKEMLNRQEVIKEILKNEKCFFVMNIDTSISILNDLGITGEEAKTVYKELIDYKYF